MVDLLLGKFEICLPSQLVASDESMIKFESRSALAVYAKKNYKMGYKVLMLADKSGYCLKCVCARVISHLKAYIRGKNHIL